MYGFTESSFFSCLRSAGVDLFCDVRARRGLRGSQYAFANSLRLQRSLAEHGIAYVHCKELAPSPETRAAQESEDRQHGIPKRSREVLGAAFLASYREECLADFDAHRFLVEHLAIAERPVFCCVERSPEACHRSLLASQIAEQTGLPVEHLMP